MTNNVGEFNEVVKGYRDRIETAIKQKEEKRLKLRYSEKSSDLNKVVYSLNNDWLLQLHKQYKERFLADNNRIWFSAQILIPTSLIPFVALAAAKTPPIFEMLGIYAFISIVFVVFWHVIAETHKSFQEKNLAHLCAIEQILGLNSLDLPNRVFNGNCNSIFLKERNVLPIFRELLVLSICVIWLMVILIYPK